MPKLCHTSNNLAATAQNPAIQAMQLQATFPNATVPDAAKKGLTSVFSYSMFAAVADKLRLASWRIKG